MNAEYYKKLKAAFDRAFDAKKQQYVYDERHNAFHGFMTLLGWYAVEIMADLEELAQIKQCDGEIARCVAAQSDPAHDQKDRLGALVGEMDWRSEKAGLKGKESR